MDNEKYYTPHIEEFYVGFEYEIFEDFDSNDTKKWHEQIYGTNGINNENIGYINNTLLSLNLVRVKYLNKEDIESLGWTPHLNRSTEYYWIKKADISFYLDVNEFYIHIGMGLLESIKNIHLPRTTFYGTIKNKSELKKIMQQIGIL